MIPLYITCEMRIEFTNIERICERVRKIETEKRGLCACTQVEAEGDGREVLPPTTVDKHAFVFIISIFEKTCIKPCKNTDLSLLLLGKPLVFLDEKIQQLFPNHRALLLESAELLEGHSGEKGVVLDTDA